MKRGGKRKTSDVTPETLLKRIKSLEKQVTTLTRDLNFNDNLVYFCASGTHYYATLKATIDQHPDSLLYKMVHGSVPVERMPNGAIFVDRSPTRFAHILDYMRTGVSPAMTTRDEENYKDDLDYYQLPYEEPWTSAERAARDNIAKWMEHEDDYGYYWKIQLTGDKNYRKQIASKVYSDYCCYCSIQKEPCIKEIVLWSVLRKLGVEIKNGYVHHLYIFSRCIARLNEQQRAVMYALAMLKRFKRKLPSLSLYFKPGRLYDTLLSNPYAVLDTCELLGYDTEYKACEPLYANDFDPRRKCDELQALIKQHNL